MRPKEHQEYEDISYLIQTPEWRAWTGFLETRRLGILDKVIRQVRDNNFDGAVRSVAVLDDITRQLKMFQQRKTELEEKAREQN